MTAPPDGMAPPKIPKIPANLPELVSTAFHRARASGDVHFFPTQVALVNVNSLPFQLRFSPALASKPRAPQPPAPHPSTNTPPPSKQEKKPFFDPFDSPPEAMLVTPLAPSHNLVLNKFAIVPEHFILATQAYKEQTHLLEQEDLEVAWSCIQAYHHHTPQPPNPPDGSPSQPSPQPRTSSELFVFFNSGPASGSSQPHRHIQMLPIQRMREGLSSADDSAWSVLATALTDDAVRRRLPFQTFAERIPSSSGADLLETYHRLYRQACEAVLGSSAAAEVEASNGEARVDYNLALTKEVMVIAPRVVEGAVVSTAAAVEGGRQEVGLLALNGTVLAGTALVKTQEEWDALREEPEQVAEILGRVGVPVRREGAGLLATGI